MLWGFSVALKNVALYSYDCMNIVGEITEESESLSVLAKKNLSPV